MTQDSLAKLRTARGLTQRAVAQALGLSPGNYNEIESGKRNLPAHHIAKLAELFTVAPRTVIEASGSARLEKLLGALATTAATGADTLPVYNAAQATAKGLINLNSAANDSLPRPAFMRGIRQAFALEITGEEMIPRYEPGERVLVSADTAPRKGTDCVAKNSAGHAFVRRYLGTKDGHVLLQQFNPSLTLKIPEHTVEALYAVVGRVDVA